MRYLTNMNQKTINFYTNWLEYLIFGGKKESVIDERVAKIGEQIYESSKWRFEKDEDGMIISKTLK